MKKYPPLPSRQRKPKKSTGGASHTNPDDNSNAAVYLRTKQMAGRTFKKVNPYTGETIYIRVSIDGNMIVGTQYGTVRGTITTKPPPEMMNPGIAMFIAIITTIFIVGLLLSLYWILQ